MSTVYEVRGELSPQDEYWLLKSFEKSTRALTYDVNTRRLRRIELDDIGAFVLELYKAGWTPERDYED